MFKWLHRGVVALLLAIAAAGTTLACIRFDVELLERERQSTNGAFGFHMGTVERGLSLMWTVRPPSLMAGSRQFSFEFAGFKMYRAAWGPSFGTSVFIPFWMIAVVAAPYPCFFLCRTYRRRRRRPANACPNCLYDLTRNESGVCPECGEAVEVAA